MIAAAAPPSRGRGGKLFAIIPSALSEHDTPTKKPKISTGLGGGELYGSVGAEGRAIKWGRVNPQAEATNSAHRIQPIREVIRKGGWGPWGSKSPA